MHDGPKGKYTRHLWPLLSFVIVGSLLIWHSRGYARFLSDDALISLRYARRFVEGHGLTWTQGERVEGYTDFFWVLLAAAGGWMRCDYVTAALALDRVGVLMAVAMVGLSPTTGRWSTPRLLAGGGLLATSVPMAVWANGGLEHGFMTGVLALGLFLVERGARNPDTPRRWLAGIPLAMLTLLRADGILLAALAVAGVFLAGVLDGGLAGLVRNHPRRLMRRCFAIAFLPVIAATAQVAFRRLYYGAWQPNTALAKLAFNRDRLLLGLDYLLRGYRAIWVMMAVALLATVALRTRARSVLIVRWALILGWTAYLGAVGGDIFPGWRQLIFVFVPFSMLAAELSEHAAEAMRAMKGWPKRLALVMAALVTGVAMYAHLAVQAADSENRRAAGELWEWDGFGVADLLKRAFGAKGALLAVDAAGSLPYWSELPSLDMLGLNDAYIAKHPPPSFGHGQIGHELGDGAYVLRRAPDLIAFNGATGFHEPLFLSGRQLLSMPEFRGLYQWIKVEPVIGTRARGEIWVRREGSRVGVVRRPDRIDVPGYFVTGAQSDAVARLDARQSLVAEAFENRFGVLPDLDVPAGCWRLTVDPVETEAREIGIRCDSLSMQASGSPGTVIELHETRSIGVAVGPRLGSQSSTPIETLTFTRVSDCSESLRCIASGEPLVVRPERLSVRKPEHLPWAHPTNLVLGAAGVVVAIDARQSLRRIRLSADNDDRYALEIRRNGNALWRGEVDAAYNGGGLALRSVYLAEDLLVDKGDELVVFPLAGDGRYAVGHLVLED